MDTEPVVIIVGNGFVKVAYNGEYYTFESVIAVEQPGIDFAGFKVSKDFIIEYKGKRIAIGHEAVSKHSNIPVTAMDRSRIGGDHHKTLLAAAMARFIGKSCRVVLATTLPIDWYKEKDTVKRSLAGEYVVKYNGKTFTFLIDQKDIRTVPEGFGVLCLDYLDDEGCVRQNGIEKAKVGVIECGTGTTDLSFFDSLEVIPRLTTSLNYGLSNEWRGLQAIIKQEYKRTFPLHEIDKIIRQGYFKQGGKPIKVDGYVAQVLPDLTNAIYSEVNTLWEQGNAADVIYIAGGGGPDIFPYSPYKHSRKVDLGYAADAAGLLRYLLFRVRNSRRK